jgi:putative ABC transport system permease protein
MSDTNRAMSWRIIRRQLGANRSRLFVILLALGAGAAITAALLNLQVDARRRLTTEFRAFGANVIIAPPNSPESGYQTLASSVAQRIPTTLEGQQVRVFSVLYVAANAFTSDPYMATRLIVAGGFGNRFTERPAPTIVVFTSINKPACWVGVRAAAHLRVKAQDVLTLRTGGREESCRVDYAGSVGGPEDDQVAVPLDLAQRLASMPDRVSLIQISAPGTPAAIDRYIADLQKRLPEADVRPLRQFTEGESRIYNRISGLLDATVAVILVLTALCVMAAMTNVAMERKNDVGLMKAIGGATRRVLRLFLAEAALLGLIGGILGAAVGIVLSMWLGHAVFGVAARPRLIVYPVAVALTVIVAIAGAYPLRRLATIRPASVFRGEA